MSEGPPRTGSSRTDRMGDVVTTLKILGGILVVLLVLGLIGWFVAAPFFQPIIYGALFRLPIVTVYWIPGSIIFGSIYIYLFVSGQIESANRLGLAYGFFIVVLLGMMFVGGIQAHEALGHRTQAKLTTHTLASGSGPTTQEQLPQLDAQNLRLVPIQTAQIDANNNFRASQFKPGSNPDITYINSTPYWSFPLLPDSGHQHWAGEQNGSLYVNQTNSNGEVHVVRGNIKHGDGVVAWHSYLWNLQRHRYWYSYQSQQTFDSVTHLPQAGKTTHGSTEIVTPLVQYHYHWFGPIPYTLPTYSGAAVTHSNGSVTYLSPQQVQSNPELHDDNTYPYWLAQHETPSLNWNRGWWNHFWQKQGIVKLASGSKNKYSNQLPYVVQAHGGSKQYYVPVSPQGSGGGLKSIYLVNGQNGTFQRYQTGAKHLVGPQSTEQYVQGGPTPPGVTNWNEYQVVEILPVIHRGHLYWMGRVVRKGGPGMPDYAFVNATNPQDVVYAHGPNKDALARKFARGEPISSSTSGHGQTHTSRKTRTTANGSTVTRIVVRQNGHVVGSFNVSGNTTITFKSHPNTQTRKNTAR